MDIRIGQVTAIRASEIDRDEKIRFGYAHLQFGRVIRIETANGPTVQLEMIGAELDDKDALEIVDE